MTPGADWAEVDLWARRRAEEHGDLYGWSREDRPERVLLLVSEHAKPESFPDRIADLPVQLKPVPEPERQ
jgi:hypothetical protein